MRSITMTIYAFTSVRDILQIEQRVDGYIEWGEAKESSKAENPCVDQSCQAKWPWVFQYISVDIGGEDGGDIALLYSSSDKWVCGRSE